MNILRKSARIPLLACTGVLIGGLWFSSASAAVINVPADQPTISAAIGVAAPNDTVQVAAGSYEEQVEITKDVELLGIDPATTILRAPAALSPSFAIGPDTFHAVVYIHDAGNVVLRNITVDGLGRGNANTNFVGIGYRNAGGLLANCVVVDVRNEPLDAAPHGLGVLARADDGTPRALTVAGCDFSGFQKCALDLSGADLTVALDSNTITGAGAQSVLVQNGIQLYQGATGSITANTVTGFAFTPATSAAAGIVVSEADGSVTTAGNTLSEVQIGIWYIGTEGDISENTLTNTPAGMGTTPYWWGIVADPGTGTLQQAASAAPGVTFGSPVAGSGVSLAALTTTAQRNEVDGGGNGTGIEADALGTDSLSFTATENIVANCRVGFNLYREVTASLVAELHFNSIIGNTFGVRNQSGVRQNADVNWWGDAGGPRVGTNPGGGGDSVSADVDYSPWLGYGDADLGTLGFQAVSPMHWHVDATSSLAISRAVQLASTPDTISLKPGNYVDQITIDKSLTLLGETAAGVLIYPAVSDVGPSGPPTFGGSQMIVVRANDVVIDNVTLDGDSPTLTPPGVIDARNGIITDYTSGGTWHNLTISNSVIRNVFWRGVMISANLSSAGHVVRGNRVADVSGSARSVGILFAGAYGDVVQNDVTNSGLGIAFHPGTTGSRTGGRADSNTVSDCVIGISTINTSDTLQIGFSTISGCQNGVQLLKPWSLTRVAHNIFTDCDTGLALQGGLITTPHEIADNHVTGNALFGSVGLFLTTSVGDTATGDVSAQVSRNVITNHSFGMVLKENPAQSPRFMRVTIGGSGADSDSLFGNSIFELLMADCDDSILATHNYWGTCDAVEDRIWHQVDDASLGAVDYSDALCACPVLLTGDVNEDGFTTAGDVVYMVNYIFKSGPDPLPCIATADVNCDGEITAGDLVYMVNFVFKSGPSPCDVCTIVPGSWTCP